MPKTEDQKVRLLILKDFFERETDENHIVTSADILAYLEKKETVCNRKTVYADIRTLQESGMDILLTPGRGGGYYLASRTFELAELKLLVDAVQSSKFLTDKKTLSLIAKLETLCSRYEASQLRRQVTVSGRVKNMNESIFYNVDRIQSAIAQGRKIFFRYYSLDIDGKKLIRGPRTVSPYFLVWDDENYYLVGAMRHRGIIHFRVDKMDSIRITDYPCEEPEGAARPNPADYSQRVFGMFSGSRVRTKLRFPRELAGVVFDRFGRDSMLIPDGDDHFVFSADVAISDQFFGWVAGLGGKAEILFPEQVRSDYAAFIRKLSASLGEKNSPGSEITGTIN